MCNSSLAHSSSFSHGAPQVLGDTDLFGDVHAIFATKEIKHRAMDEEIERMVV